MRVLVGPQYAMKIDKLNRRQDPRGGTVKQEYKVRAPAICCLVLARLAAPALFERLADRTCAARRICTYAPGALALAHREGASCATDQGPKTAAGSEERGGRAVQHWEAAGQAAWSDAGGLGLMKP